MWAGLPAAAALAAGTKGILSVQTTSSCQPARLERMMTGVAASLDVNVDGNTTPVGQAGPVRALVHRDGSGAPAKEQYDGVLQSMVVKDSAVASMHAKGGGGATPADSLAAKPCRGRSKATKSTAMASNDVSESKVIKREAMEQLLRQWDRQIQVVETLVVLQPPGNDIADKALQKVCGNEWTLVRLHDSFVAERSSFVAKRKSLKHGEIMFALADDKASCLLEQIVQEVDVVLSVLTGSQRKWCEQN